MSIEMARLRRDAATLERAIAFQVDSFKIEAESMEQWMVNKEPHPKPPKAKGVAPCEPLWQPPQEFLDFLGRERVQNKLFRPKLDDYRGVELV